MREITSHTALRGIAALMVLLFHYSWTLDPAFDLAAHTRIIEQAKFLVDLFFILSGFVMAYVYWDTFSGPGAMSHLGAFYQARFARLYPLHLLTLAWTVWLAWGAYPALIGAEWLSILCDAFLLQAWGAKDAFHFNHPSWSISAEIAAYLVFPVLVAALVARPSLALPLAVASAAALGLYVWLVASETVVWARIVLLRAIPGFVLGVLAYRYRHAVMGLSDRVLGLSQVACLAAVAGLMHLGAGLLALVPFFFALTLLTWEDRGPLARALSFRPLQVLGALAYAIYLLHVPVMATLSPAWHAVAVELGMTDGAARIALVASATGTTLLLAAAVHRGFERPMRRLLGPGGRPLDRAARWRGRAERAEGPSVV